MPSRCAAAAPPPTWKPNQNLQVLILFLGLLCGIVTTFVPFLMASEDDCFVSTPLASPMSSPTAAAAAAAGEGPWGEGDSGGGMGDAWWAYTR